MKAIFGLGNPGKQYDQTKHNMGFLAIDQLADHYNVELNKNEFSALDIRFKYQGETIYLVKPLTFMNDSGRAVRMLMDYYQIQPEEIIVIQDDLDLPVGKIRLRAQGSAGGHNGIKSIISAVGTQQFKRVKIGIGHPKQATVVDWVLTPFKGELKTQAFLGIEQAVKAVENWLEHDDFSQTMNDFN
ncbi:aminoacyl-tRNA hydrolase [Bombilactobacillus thymidiniphilus]|uniref:Peptidyl-tRNA hydrolase n=1 Tax=Bombilactobacillus thymidiniphilus TaxID=2923363 RepID=A0ABY4PFD6_9LACO|nr:aminoacyl-tRNA hydrolase [Bombilactobacillus thymidiniphilus]UQS84027.1 aminoacyl-tRNA hydrolase [Bombilactobacillus thymidiniphilus]